MPQFFKLEKKIAAGADFVITQLGYDMRKFLEVKRYMEVRQLDVPLIGNVYVLSYGAAKAMHAGKVPGCVVSDTLLETLKTEAAEPDKGKAKRLERAAKMVAMFKGLGFDGVHIGGFALKTDDFHYILDKARELEPRWREFMPEVSFSAPNEFYAFPPPKLDGGGGKTPDPIGHGRGKTSLMPTYGFALAMHRLIFNPRSLGCRLLKRFYRVVDNRPRVAKFLHINEYLLKFLFFGCRDCGDCALPDMAYCCPQSKCAKQQRNGPCGGSVKGMCEVFPDDRPCVWTIVYRRLKRAGRLKEMRNPYMPPRNNQLEHTSGWANYFLGKDHSRSLIEEDADVRGGK